MVPVESPPTGNLADVYYLGNNAFEFRTSVARLRGRPHDQDGDAKLRTNAMKVILHDFQNGSNDPFDGVQVDDSDKLCDILDQLHRRGPFILELEGDK